MTSNFYVTADYILKSWKQLRYEFFVTANDCHKKLLLLIERYEKNFIYEGQMADTKQFNDIFFQKLLKMSFIIF